MTSSGFYMLVGEGFGILIHIYHHSVQAGLIRMEPEPIHYVCSDGAQADTSRLHCGFSYKTNARKKKKQ